MTDKEMKEEITRLRKQVEDLTEALINVAMQKGPTYVPYPVAPAPVVVPWNPTPRYPWITYTSGVTHNTQISGVTSDSTPYTVIN